MKLTQVSVIIIGFATAMAGMQNALNEVRKWRGVKPEWVEESLREAWNWGFTARGWLGHERWLLVANDPGWLVAVEPQLEGAEA